MFQNYLTVAVRNLLRHKGYTAINIASLAIGMACCILVLLFIQDQFRYNRHHELSERIYRVIVDFGASGQGLRFSQGTSGALGPVLRREVPEIERVTRMFNDAARIFYNERFLGNQPLNLVEPEFFRVFTVRFVQGNAETALKDPYTIVVSESFARKAFGDEDPIGKALDLDSRYWGGRYTVTGVVKDDPHTSVFQVKLFHSTPPRNEWPRGHWEGWITKVGSRHNIPTYLVLPEGVDRPALERKLSAVLHRHTGKTGFSYHLQPLNRMHLYSKVDYGFAWYGDIEQVYLYAGIAVFIVLIACINFMNLATARAMGRAREVGLRKVVGAHRSQLVVQFLGESVVLSVLSVVLAIGLAELALPTLNGLIYTELSLTDIHPAVLLAGLFCLAVGIGLLAGSYPAFYLSVFRPSETLKGTHQTGPRGAWIRKGLVVFQFGISILLMVSTGIVYQQLGYMQSKKLGFDKDRIVILPIFRPDQRSKTDQDAWLSDRYQVVKQAFLDLPGVEKVSAFRWQPGWQPGFRRDLKPEGYGGEVWRIPVQEADEDYLNTFGISLVAGRNFSRDRPADVRRAYILNEAAVRELGWSDPVGKQIGVARRSDHPQEGTVIGVVKDFHYRSLREKIGPAAIILYSRFFTNLAVKVSGGEVQETIGRLEKTWQTFLPNEPFEFRFLDESIHQVYWREQRLARVFQWFSALAISLACLGLFGLAAFTAERRTKEIGIRKVLGASVTGLVLLLSTEFVRLVALANLIAWPIAYYTMDRWLQDFAYRIDPGGWIFVLGGLLAFTIALATVGHQAVKAALSNPVDALRYE